MRVFYNRKTHQLIVTDKHDAYAVYLTEGENPLERAAAINAKRETDPLCVSVCVEQFDPLQEQGPTTTPDGKPIDTTHELIGGEQTDKPA